MKPVTLPLTLLIGCCLSAAHAQAAINRYDLGQRLRKLDRAWAAATAEARRPAVEPLKKTVPEFLSGRVEQVAETLDTVTMILAGHRSPTGAERWAHSLVIHPARRLVDANTANVTVEIARGYGSELPIPADARVEFRMGGNRSVVLGGGPIEKLPIQCSLATERLGPGDHIIVADVRVAGESLATFWFELSLASDLSNRLKRLETAAVNSDKSTNSRTLHSHVALLQSLANGGAGETDFPAARILNESEKLVGAISRNKDFFGPGESGEHWLTLQTSGGPAPVRILVPPGLKADKPTPMVIAMHGAGGSENLFFDGYGGGITVKLCRERGWILVATRAGSIFDGAPPIDGAIEEISRLFPVDRKRIAIMGHSMGAVQSIAAVQKLPGRFAAAAALGGGGIIRNSDAVKNLPVFVGCGTEDFALSAAKLLTGELKKAGAEVTFREYRDIEHIMIVEAAAKDLFSFFDAHMR